VVILGRECEFVVRQRDENLASVGRGSLTRASQMSPCWQQPT